MPKSATIRLWLKEGLDEQRKEHLNILLARDSRVEIVEAFKDADYIVLDGAHMLGFPTLIKDAKFIVLNLGDIGNNHVGLRPQDVMYRKYIKKMNCQMIYFQCEDNPTNTKRKGRPTEKINVFTGDDNITVLTMPMGYISGSKVNIHYHNDDTEAFHINNLQKNNREYSHDWCWIGAESSPDRVKALKLLEPRVATDDCILIRSTLSEEMDSSKREVEIHADNKTVNHADFMETHRNSKVCVSMNGVGFWCYKDAELFAWNCFALRQYDKRLSVNPLSPKDGQHWVVFKNDELLDKLDYYVQNSEERERINDCGHRHFKWAINGGWAKAYAGAFIGYSQGNKDAFKPFMLKGSE